MWTFQPSNFNGNEALNLYYHTKKNGAIFTSQLPNGLDTHFPLSWGMSCKWQALPWLLMIFFSVAWPMSACLVQLLWEAILSAPKHLVQTWAMCKHKCTPWVSNPFYFWNENSCWPEISLKCSWEHLPHAIVKDPMTFFRGEFFHTKNSPCWSHSKDWAETKSEFWDLPQFQQALEMCFHVLHRLTLRYVLKLALPNRPNKDCRLQ